LRGRSRRSHGEWKKRRGSTRPARAPLCSASHFSRWLPNAGEAREDQPVRSAVNCLRSTKRVKSHPQIVEKTRN
jgi:hypothetical protein